MKINLKNTAYSILLMSLALSCKKEDTTPDEPFEITITEEDAADLVASAIGTGTYGLTSSTTAAAQKTTFAYNQSVPCLYSLDTTLSKSNPVGSAITYSYNLNYNYQMYCTNGIPTSLICNLSSSGNLDQLRMSASSTVTGALTFTGFAPSDTLYSVNGDYSRNGSATSKIRAKNSFTYTLSLDLTNVSVSKTNYSLVSGSSTVTFSATSSTGKVFNFSGTLTYVNATTATLVINGQTFTINIPESLVN